MINSFLFEMVKVSIELVKRDFVWIGLILILISAGFGVAAWDNSKAMFHDDADVRVFFNGSERSLSEALSIIEVGGGFGGGAGAGVIDCVTKATGAFTGTTTISCDAGYVRTGCSARTGDSKNADNYFGSEPIANEGCKFYNGWGSWKSSYGWATCCKIEGSGGSEVDVVTAVQNNANTPSRTLTLSEGEWLIEVNVAVTSGGSVTARNILIDGVDAGDVKGAANRDGDTSGFGTAFRTVSVVGSRDVIVAVDGTLATTLRNSVFSVKAIRVG